MSLSLSFCWSTSYLLVTLITCLKGHKSPRVLYDSVFQHRLLLTYSLTQLLSQWKFNTTVWGQLSVFQNMNEEDFPVPNFIPWKKVVEWLITIVFSNGKFGLVQFVSGSEVTLSAEKLQFSIVGRVSNWCVNIIIIIIGVSISLSAPPGDLYVTVLDKSAPLRIRFVLDNLLGFVKSDV